jgi:hypothetical protein
VLRPNTTVAPKGLTVRQRKLVHGLVAGQRPTDAARAAGYSEATAVHGITRLMAGAPFRAALSRSLSRAGITDTKLWAGLKDGLTALETKFFADKGQVTDQRDVIAWGPRHQHLETALRLKGYLGRESVDAEPLPAPAVTVTINLAALSDEEFRQAKALRDKALGREPAA